MAKPWSIENSGNTEPTEEKKQSGEVIKALKTLEMEEQSNVCKIEWSGLKEEVEAKNKITISLQNKEPYKTAIENCTIQIEPFSHDKNYYWVSIDWKNIDYTAIKDGREVMNLYEYRNDSTRYNTFQYYISKLSYQEAFANGVYFLYIKWKAYYPFDKEYLKWILETTVQYATFKDVTKRIYKLKKEWKL